LRNLVPQDRLRLVHASRREGEKLAAAVDEFRTQLETQMVTSKRPPAYHRRTI
jgi:coenzyme F420-reducing hydrogenase delta subunit